jgi:hypothetical protein
VAAELLPAAVQLLQESTDEETLTYALWALCYFTNDSNENGGARLQLTVECGVCTRLVELLQHPSSDVQAPALLVVGNFSAASTELMQAMIDAGVLEVLKEQLRAMRAGCAWQNMNSACSALSNFFAGSEAQIQAAINAELPQLMVRINCGDLPGGGRVRNDVRREAFWAITNATAGGTPAQIHALLRAGVLPRLALALMAASHEEAKFVMPALTGLEKILRAGPAMAAAGLLPLAHLIMLFKEADVPRILKGLASPSWLGEAISSKAREVQQAFFPAAR